jgi:peroxisomal 2,4-dienoyl-CoA reductase
LKFCPCTKWYNSAGAAGNFLAPITGLSSNAFKTVMEIDVLGSYNALKATLPHLEKSAKANPNDGKNASTGGRIIFISATLHYAGRTFQTHAMAAKAAVDAISSGAAIELGPRGITSNIIAPGPIGGTEGMERLSRADTQSRAAALRSIPSGRWGTVKEIADAGVYLFADTGNYVNGATIVVDGGEWRTMAQYSSDPKVRYPDDVLNFQMPEGAKSGRKEKAKL